MFSFATHASGESPEEARAYSEFEKLVAERVAAVKGMPLFTTDAAPAALWNAYLSSLPMHRQQHYSCRACQHYIERYGGLVWVHSSGRVHSAIWPDVEDTPDFFKHSANLLTVKVDQAEISGVFYSSGKTWGTPKTFDPKRDATWTHLHALNPAPYKSNLKSVEQAIAEKREDHGMLCRAIAEFPIAVVQTAVNLLSAGNALDRTEKVLGVAQWLLKLHKDKDALHSSEQRSNIVWLAVATAPVGFCHVRSSMIGTLLEDIAAGTMDFDTIKARWSKKMHPLQYQRPTAAAPKDGAIAAAEKIVEQLQSAGALNRRFARLEDILAWLWRPVDGPRTAPDAQQGSGVFSHLRGLGGATQPLQMPTETMTWVKFRDAVLPIACKLEYSVPSSPASYFGMVTAENCFAEPILQWDGLCYEDGLEQARNPVSWYYNVYGSPPQRWGLIGGEWRTVNGICLPPYHWQRPESFKHFGESIFFILAGMADTTYTAGAGFFPECLKSEYHSIRSVMEAYAKRAVVSGAREGTANGLGLQRGQPWNCTLRVNGDRTYKLDRWD